MGVLCPSWPKCLCLISQDILPRPLRGICRNVCGASTMLLFIFLMAHLIRCRWGGGGAFFEIKHVSHFRPVPITRHVLIWSQYGLWVDDGMMIELSGDTLLVQSLPASMTALISTHPNPPLMFRCHTEMFLVEKMKSHFRPEIPAGEKSCSFCRELLTFTN